MSKTEPEPKPSLYEKTAITVRIEFGSRCIHHGLPEYIQLSKLLESYFQKSVVVEPHPKLFLNHFRVYVGPTLVFDSYTRYPPAMEVVKCVEDALAEVFPREIPHRRSIPFSYWKCPEHEGVFDDDPGRQTVRKPSSVSSSNSVKDEDPVEKGVSPKQKLTKVFLKRHLPLFPRPKKKD